MTMELLPEHLSKLDEMSALLRISQDFTIAFVRCNEPVLRDAVNAEIKNIVSDEVFIYDIKMDENSCNLLSLLNEAVSLDSYSLRIKDNKKLAFFVFGLDKAIEKKNPDGKSEALLIMNMMREEFLKIRHAIIIWINSASLSLILKDAQDFFSWRTTVFEFDMAHTEVQKISVEFEDTELWSLTKKELEERWESYSGLLKDYREKGIEDAHKFAYWNYNLGMIRLLQGHSLEALKFFEDSLNFSEKIIDKKGVEDSLGRLGQAYHNLGQVEKAILYHEKALEIAREIGDRRKEEEHLGNIGNEYRVVGEVGKSIEYYEKSEMIAKEIGDIRNEGIWLGNLGIDYRFLGDTEKAINYLKKALEIAEEIKDLRNVARWLTDIGLVHRDRGCVKEAMGYYEKAMIIAREIGDIRREGFLFGEFGFAYISGGEIEKAKGYYEKALAMARDIGDKSNENKWLGGLGRIYYNNREEEKAIEYYKKALKIAREIGNRRFEGRWLNDMGEVFVNRKKYKEAIVCFLLAKKIRAQIESPALETTILNLERFKNELSEDEFEKLMDKVEKNAEEFVEEILRKAN